MKSGISVDEMRAELLRQRGAQADFALDTRRLEMEASGAGIVLRLLDKHNADFVEPFDVSGNTHRQIGTHLEIPYKYYDKMLLENPELLVHNLNSWFRRKPAMRLVRTLDGVVRAYLSNRYRRIDHLEILQAVLPVIGRMPDARFESCQITDQRMYIKVLNPRLQMEVSPGDIVQAGVVISNSETGQGSVCVQPLVLRLVCMNGMTVNDAGTRKYHSGRITAAEENYLAYSDKTLEADDIAFLMKVQDTVSAAVDEARFSQVVDLMRDAKEAPMQTPAIPEIVKLTSRSYKLTETESNGVLGHLINDRDHTLYGLANAVTRYSQDVESYDRATDLESIGYDILSMGRTRWNSINAESAQISAAA